MNSLAFPDMFKFSSTSVVKDREASAQDMKLLLASEKGEMFGDPFFGIRIKKYAFEQNNYVLKDVLIDEIYTQLQVFCPQLTVSRDGISITQRGARLTATIKGVNKIDFTPDTYQLELFQDEEQ